MPATRHPPIVVAHPGDAREGADLDRAMWVWATQSGVRSDRGPRSLQSESGVHGRSIV